MTSIFVDSTLPPFGSVSILAQTEMLVEVFDYKSLFQDEHGNYTDHSTWEYQTKSFEKWISFSTGIADNSADHVAFFPQELF